MGNARIKVYYNDWPKRVGAWEDGHHSVATLRSWDDTLVELYAYANCNVRNSICAWPDGAMEAATNLRLSGVQFPERLAERIRAKIAEINYEDIDAEVGEALNAVYDQLKRHGNDPEFVEHVARAAREWAQVCVDEGGATEVVG